MARPQKTPALPAHTELDEARIDGAVVAMRQDATAGAMQHDRAVFDLGQKVGAIQMARLQQSFSAAAEVRLFDELRESNKFKELALPRADGTSAAAESFQEFCSVVFGLGYKAMNERKLDLLALGEQAYETATRLGLNRRQLRMVRALPDAEREAVTAAMASGTKAEVVAVIEDLAAKLSEQQAENAELKADAEAQAQVRADLHQKLDKERAKLKRISKLPPDQQLAELHKEAGLAGFEAHAVIMGTLRPALQALADLEEAHGSQSVVMAGLVGHVQAALTGLREQFNLPDVSNAADLKLAAEVAEWAK
ncbi:hypothetical protein MW290_12125 [Aquincola tertiaricarbonis]|uniref:Uncharacterized protein n=1 Tax=Aquincola tertiaricarbonis TaxID=391953 RepID=A0ABY4S610_AQUTE|nr:hypothetical protein [Aquincola tertiaricarbonis]URI06644.1 hypothetical protein MW290_12125 [Aquincola tertiaricarbonis]